MLLKPLWWGVAAAGGLLTVYAGVLTLVNSAEHALTQFLSLWYLMVPLLLGFGAQVGLFVYMRDQMRAASAGSSVAVSGGVSTTSMVACCAHHISDVAPLLGLSALALFLARWQMMFLAVGVVSSLIGLNIMLLSMQRHGLYGSGSGLLAAIMKYDMKSMLYATGGTSAAALAVLLWMVW